MPTIKTPARYHFVGLIITVIDGTAEYRVQLLQWIGNDQWIAVEDKPSGKQIIVQC
jgi:hypothetical protein